MFDSLVTILVFLAGAVLCVYVGKQAVRKVVILYCDRELAKIAEDEGRYFDGKRDALLAIRSEMVQHIVVFSVCHKFEFSVRREGTL